jgi:tetratricopeptide (TPR) repeat protein
MQKKRIIFRAVCWAVAAFWLAGWVKAARVECQDQLQSECSVERTQQYYKDFLESYEGLSRDQAKALEAAKKYLACSDESSNQEENLAKLNLAVGRILSARNLSSDAIPYFIKAASYNSTVKALPQTYVNLATAYEDGPYARLSEEYRKRFEGKDETRESLLALENIYPIVDSMIDAYARAIALTGVKPQNPQQGTHATAWTKDDPVGWMQTLTELYRFRHNGSVGGLREMILTVLARPLPPEPARSEPKEKTSTSTKPGKASSLNCSLTPFRGDVSITFGTNVVS